MTMGYSYCSTRHRYTNALASLVRLSPPSLLSSESPELLLSPFPSQSPFPFPIDPHFYSFNDYTHDVSDFRVHIAARIMIVIDTDKEVIGKRRDLLNQPIVIYSAKNEH